MLTSDEFEAWCQRLHLPESTRKLVERIRTSEPSRKVKSSAANVSGLYCSKKMGLTMQFESHKVELPIVVTKMEWDNSVLEYYDQPESIKLNYKSKLGKSLGVIYTPDFFVVRSDGAGYEEYKTEQELEKLSKKNPGRYFKDENGVWRCPPGENFAAQFGLYFRVRSSAEINWVCYRNLEYLQDYFRSNYQVSAETKSEVLALVECSEGITFHELVTLGGSFSVDDLNALLASGELYLDINKNCFDDLKSLKIYSSKQQAEFRYGKESTGALYTDPIDIEVGKILIWDGVIHQIINVGDNTATLKSENGDLKVLEFSQIQHLISANQLKPKKAGKEGSVTEKAQQIIQSASTSDLDAANYRANIVKRYINGERELNVPARTIRDWVQKYNLAKQMWGEGYIGLIPKNGKKGNRSAKILPEVQELIHKSIKEHYENGIKTTMIHAYGFLQKLVKKRDILRQAILLSVIMYMHYLVNMNKL